MEQTDLNLKILPYWNSLSEDEKTFVRAHSAVHAYQKGALIHSGGCECLGMLLVLRGEIRTYILSEEGREITLFRLRKGDPCVLSASCVVEQITFDTQMTAETDCELLVVNSASFEKLTSQNIYVRCFMFELLCERFSSVMWTMQMILFKGYDRRLAAFLTEEYDRTGRSEIKMTHEQIAQHTNSAREVVARMLKRFASEDLVEFKRGSIRLKDIESLRRMI